MPPRSSAIRHLAAGAALAASLSGCAAVGPDFKAPEPPKGRAGAGYAMAGDPAAAEVRLDPQARAAGPWWTAFGAPELDEVIRLALADSPTVAEAAATLQRAQAQAAVLQGERRPQADLNAGARRERINTSTFGFAGFPSPTINLFSVGGTVSYDLDAFGGRRRAAERGEARAQAAAQRADAAYLALSANVATQALRIAALRAQVAAMQAVVADDLRIADMVRRAQDAGGAAPSATTSVQAQLAEDQALLPPLERDLAAARHQLASLVGRAPAEWTPPDFDMARLSAPDVIPATLPSDLVRRRPDILAAEAELHAATADIGVATANLYPDIRLSASLSQTATKPEDVFGYSATGWDLLSGVSAPILNGGALKAERRAAEAEARAAMARYQQTVLRAFVQVSDVLAALGTDRQKLAARDLALSTAQASLHEAEADYRLGGAPLMDVVDAQRRLNRARRDVAEAKGRQYLDLVELYAATAADWRAAP